MHAPRPPRSDVLSPLLTALVLVLVLQALRVLVTGITWYLRDTVGVPTLQLIPVAFAPFLLAATIPLLTRIAPPRSVVAGMVVLAGGARLALQVTDAPDADLVLGSLTVAAAVGALALLGRAGRTAFVLGGTLGIVLDASIRGFGFSVDLPFRSGIAGLALTGALVAIAVALAYRTTLDGTAEAIAGWPLLGLGPWLFAHALVLQSPGWASQVTGIDARSAWLLLTLLNLGAVALVWRFGSSRPARIAGLVAVVGALVGAEAPAALFAVLVVAGVLGGGLALAAVAEGTRPDGRPGWITAGVAVFILGGLAYYLPQDLALPFDADAVRYVVAGALLAIGTDRVRTPTDGSVTSWQDAGAVVVGAAGAAVVLPLLGMFGGGAAGAPPPDAPGELTVATYNLHSAFDPTGRFDVEAIARAIEATDAEVIGLQEVDRGRLLNGSVDVFALLQRRLGYGHAAFHGTTGPDWGNAILSRYPLADVESGLLPRAGTPLQRGYLAASVDDAGGDVWFVVTHLQHVAKAGDLTDVHRAQLDVVLDAWDDRAPAVLVGDLNAEPNTLQIEGLLASGWVDAWATGEGDGYTFPSDAPDRRIDWVLHTPDLQVLDVDVLPATASDHRAVTARLRLP